jgi:hypothetical protein
MDKEQVKNQSGLAIRVSNLRVTGDIHPDYRSVHCDSRN